MECLDPPLQEVPVDEWFCPECGGPEAATAAGKVLPWLGVQGWGRLGSALCSCLSSVDWGGSHTAHGSIPCALSQCLLPLVDAVSGSEDEVSLLLADVVPTSSRLRPRSSRTRAIARTRQSERVRATVNRNRLSTARSIGVGVGSRRAGAAQLCLLSAGSGSGVLESRSPPCYITGTGLVSSWAPAFLVTSSRAEVLGRHWVLLGDGGDARHPSSAKGKGHHIHPCSLGPLLLACPAAPHVFSAG